jgi:hypothetical protein
MAQARQLRRNPPNKQLDEVRREDGRSAPLQSEDDVEPLGLEKPDWQCSQVVAPVRGWKVPLPQSAHGARPLRENEPGLQGP